jgi:uncharacterized membrane protein
MTYCAKCGASLNQGAAFCTACGTHAPGGAAPQPTAPPPPIVLSGLDPNIAAALSYLLGLITGVIFLSIAPGNKNPFVRFHAFQSIFLSVAYIVFFIIWGSLFSTLAWVDTGFLWSMIGVVGSLVRLAFFLLWLFLMYKAYNNERYSLPVIGPLAAKQAG